MRADVALGFSLWLGFGPLGWAGLWAQPVSTPGAVVEPAIVTRATVSDAPTVGRMLEALGLVSVAPASVTSLEVIDLTRNGFGDGDVVRLNPSGDVRVIGNVDRDLWVEMEAWLAAVQREQHFSPSVEPAALEAQQDPAAAIIGGILRAVDRNYNRAMPVSLFLTSDGKERGVFEMWGYVADSLIYSPGSEPAGEGATRYDLVDVVRRQTEIIAADLAYDLLYVQSTSRDTLILPGGEPPAGDEVGFVHEVGGPEREGP